MINNSRHSRPFSINLYMCLSILRLQSRRLSNCHNFLNECTCAWAKRCTYTRYSYPLEMAAVPLFSVFSLAAPSTCFLTY